MKTDKQNIIEAETIEEKSITVQAPQKLDKPKEDTEFAQVSSQLLMDIVEKNKWAKRLGGDKAHLAYEAWQTLGKYYAYTVKTHDAEPIMINNINGFKAQATVVNEMTGVEVGSAEAFCMRDENNWKSKPTFQLASMAQTRAGAKALRQILGFVVALAGYSPTPSEEMDGVQVQPVHEEEARKERSGLMATEKQRNFIKSLLKQKNYTEHELLGKYDISSMEELTSEQASDIIGNLQKIEPRKAKNNDNIADDAIKAGI